MSRSIGVSFKIGEQGNGLNTIFRQNSKLEFPKLGPESTVSGQPVVAAGSDLANMEYSNSDQFV